MSRIIKGAVAKGDQGQEHVEVLFDSGATNTFVKRSIAQRIAMLSSLPFTREVTLANDHRGATIRESVTIDLLWDHTGVRTLAYVADELAHDVIIGATTMEDYHIALHLREGQIIFSGPTTETELLSYRL